MTVLPVLHCGHCVTLRDSLRALILLSQTVAGIGFLPQNKCGLNSTAAECKWLSGMGISTVGYSCWSEVRLFLGEHIYPTLGWNLSWT